MNIRKILGSLIFSFMIFVPVFSVQAEENPIIDITPPVISLIGLSTFELSVGQTYIDEGATAIDDIDGDISANIIKSGSVDASTAGTYNLSYDVTDSTLNNAITVIRTVIVNDIPIIPTTTFLIRNGDNVIYTGSIDLPAAGTVDVQDNAGTVHSVNTHSVLGVIYALDQSSDSFSLSNLQYYDSFSSFYLKCITPLSGNELCDNWQYTVGGVSPFTSVDSTMLSGGETIGLYFGNPYRVNLSATSINTSQTITATTESYNYLDDTWVIRTGVNVGITKSNPLDSWNPIIVSTHPVDANGQAVLSFTEEGFFNVGVSEDYYFPSYGVTVSPISSGGGGTVLTFSTDRALNFLTLNQNNDGSFGNMLFTDWAAIALSSMGNQANSSKLQVMNYIKNNPMQSSIVTDNERHAMALMSLGINPYTGTDINYINKITSSFDGTQFGDDSLVNDDMFALIVLKNAGYISGDEIMKKDVSYIIGEQLGDGSWGSVDMTAAGIQALRNFVDLPGVSASITLAEDYLLNSQNGDGGFGNSFATSWAIQALSLNGSFGLQINKANEYLASLQQTDGGLDLNTDSLENRIWSTSYAIPAILSKPWSSILQSFSKKISENTSEDTEVLPVVMAPEIKMLAVEIKDDSLEEIKVAPKKILPKVKLSTTKKVIESPTIVNENNNDLSASVAGATSSQSLPYRIIHSFIALIKAPFVWLLVQLGF